MIRATLSKRFPGGRESVAFSLEVDFTAGAGVTVLFGPSGSGKTLTLDAVAGFVTPDAGRIEVSGEALFDSAARVNVRPRQRRCGYVFQDYALFPHMTLRRNLEFAAGVLPAGRRAEKVAGMLTRFHLADVAGRRPHEVSGGQQQRCSIARALVGEPRLLLLDEPARGLDAPLRDELYAVLRQVRRDFATPVLLVTHDLDECFELGDTVLVMHAGRIVQRGAPREILEHPASLDVVRLLGRFNLLPATVADPGSAERPARYRTGDAELAGPGSPSLAPGCAVTLYCRPEALRATPGANPGPGRLVARLERVVELPQAIRLQFAGGLRVEAPAGSAGTRDNGEEWTIEIPPESLGHFQEGKC